MDDSVIETIKDQNEVSIEEDVEEEEEEEEEEEVELIQAIADYRPVEKESQAAVVAAALSAAAAASTSLLEENLDVSSILNESSLSDGNEVEMIQPKNQESRRDTENTVVVQDPVVVAVAAAAAAVVFTTLPNLNDSNSDVVILNDSF
jgi:hypothetical protein